MSALLSQRELLDWTEFERPRDLEKWLIKNKIPYTKGKGGAIITAQAAIDAFLVGDRIDGGIEQEFML